jgi:hypothetical protein
VLPCFRRPKAMPAEATGCRDGARPDCGHATFAQVGPRRGTWLYLFGPAQGRRSARARHVPSQLTSVQARVAGNRAAQPTDALRRGVPERSVRVTSHRKTRTPWPQERSSARRSA